MRQENADDIILSAVDLSHSYGGESVFSNLSFEVVRGEFLSILGSSGGGKTTLLRVLTGLLKPNAGRIYLSGEDITDAAPDKRRMGIVFQNLALFENMTVLGNVEYALKIKKETRGIARDTAMKLIEHLGLSGHENKRPALLSGGQQQRVAIARTIAVNPQILLFDEPMSSLDIATRLSLRTVIQNIKSGMGTTMIYVTHDQEEAFAMSDRIMVMHNGRIAQLDTPQNIIASPADSYVQEFVLNNLKQKARELTKYLEVDR